MAEFKIRFPDSTQSVTLAMHVKLCHKYCCTYNSCVKGGEVSSALY